MILSFRERFGTDPHCAASAPGRVNLIGEHTDYNEGFVLPVAIDRRTWVLGAATKGDGSTLHSLELDRSIRFDASSGLDPIPHGDPDFFANYVLGVVHELARLGHALPHLDLLITSDVPIGAGLSSSAALEVAAATLFESLLEIALDPLARIKLCQRAEHAFPGTPCGLMDMYIAVAAVDGHALLIDCRSETSRTVPIPRDTALLIVDSGVRHELAQSEYAARRSMCSDVARILGRSSLRDVTPAMLDDPRLTDLQRSRATHVLTENARTLHAVEALESGDVARFGDLMIRSHVSLRDQYDVSCPELDAIVDRALHWQGRGVHGARMTGGGFGGCAVVLCEPAAVDDVARDITRELEMRFEHRVRSLVTGASGPARLEACS